MAEKSEEVYFTSGVYKGGQKQVITSNCNTITFVNQGLGDVKIGNFILRAGVPVVMGTPTTGDSYTDECWPLEYNTTQYQVTPLDVNPIVIFWRKKMYKSWGKIKANGSR